MTTEVRSFWQRSMSLFSLAAFSVMVAGCGGGPVPAPTSYKTWENKDGGVAVDYPEGWDADGGGKKNTWASFEKGSAKIKLQTDITGSLLGDMAGGPSDKLGPPSDEDYPVHKVHVLGKDAVAAEFSDYKEEKPTKFQNAIGGEGRKSEFSASGGFSGPVKGYRATFLSRDRRFTVICTCAESDWATLKPAFDKVLESFRSAG